MPVLDRRYDRAGLLLWGAALTVVSVLVAIDPSSHSVTPVFHLAAHRWWAQESLYADIRGFHYLPQFALLFAPFHVLPSPLGDILWRFASVGACVYGIRAVITQFRSAAPGRFFFYTSLLALAPCLGAVRNGQTNLTFAGVSMLAAALLADSRWWQAAACLAVLVAIKPLGLILLVLAAVAYPPLRKWLVAALALLVAIPFLFAPWGYVVAQYRDAVHHLAGLSGTTEHRFADVAGLLRAAGVELPLAWSRSIRILAGIATLLVSVIASSSSAGPRRALTLVLLASTYLMLFNPMTEKNTYAIVAPPLAVSAVYWLSLHRSVWVGWALAFVLVSIGVFPELFSRFDPRFGLWWDPLMMALVYGFLAVKILRREALFPFADVFPVGSTDERRG